MSEAVSEKGEVADFQPSQTTTKNNEHLVVLVHGMWGSPSDLIELKKEFSKKVSSNCLIIPSSNSFLRSYDGIDKCGERLAMDIVKAVAESFPSSSVPKHISIIGYSAGGLVARYAIGNLEKLNFFDKISPSKFITIATPHIGVRYSKNKLSGKFMNSALPLVSNLYGGRSLDHMSLVDRTINGLPLLVEMSKPSSIYIEALSKFDVSFYANARKDLLVSYCTATVSSKNPFRGFDYGTLACAAGNDFKFVLKEEMNVPNESTKDRQSNELMNASNDRLVHVKKMGSFVLKTSLFPVVLGCLLLQTFIFMLPLRIASLLVQRFSNHNSETALEDVKVILPEKKTLEPYMEVNKDISPFCTCSEKKKKPGVLDTLIFPKEAEINQHPSFPDMIRDNLVSSIKFQRVVCWLPGNINTHGKIIFRRGHSHYRDGKEVISHIANSF